MLIVIECIKKTYYNLKVGLYVYSLALGSLFNDIVDVLVGGKFLALMP